jgi:hypothetical protein
MKKRGMKGLSKNAIISLIVGFLSLVFDQAYHIIFHQYHQIFTIFEDPYTSIYIGSKFLIVFLISMIVLRLKMKSIILKSAIIGIVSAFLFSLILTYLFPYLYTIWLHIFHAFAIFAGAIIALWVEKKWKFP